MAVYSKGTWQDRDSQYPSKRALTVVTATGTSGLAAGDVITANVERDEGTITAQGTAFNHTNMDAFEERIRKTFGIVKAVTKLYSTNATDGMKEDFSLLKECNHYDFLGVYYVAHGGKLSGYTEIAARDNTEFVCSISYPNNSHTNWIIRSAFVTIGNDWKSVSFSRNGSITIYTDGTRPSISTANDQKIGIRRVVGYTVESRTPTDENNMNIPQ